jgi:hypothetical protein
LEPGSNSGRHGGKPVTIHLSYGPVLVVLTRLPQSLLKYTVGPVPFLTESEYYIGSIEPALYSETRIYPLSESGESVKLIIHPHLEPRFEIDVVLCLCSHRLLWHTLWGRKLYATINILNIANCLVFYESNISETILCFHPQVKNVLSLDVYLRKNAEYSLRIVVLSKTELNNIHKLLIPSGTLKHVVVVRTDISENISPQSSGILRVIIFHSRVTVEYHHLQEL